MTVGSPSSIVTNTRATVAVSVVPVGLRTSLAFDFLSLQLPPIPDARCCCRRARSARAPSL
ncbi:hypothetical protein PF003_g11387 [Phytophthora fragariae]|nr:hypothetical protein PF003_g11387 [Phytophthora fragariae]